MSNTPRAAWGGVAVDLGASAGRVLVGRFDGARLTAEEVHRFANEPVQLGGTLYWDILRIHHDILHGLRAACAACDDASGAVTSLGIDAWGVDFGLLDGAGHLLGNPVHYRDRRTDGVMERVCSRISKEIIFRTTGIQFLPFNTLFQLAAMVESGHPHVEAARTLLMIPDLLQYFLTGNKASEFTNATTTQLYDPTRGTWATELMAALDIPERLFLPVVQPGTSLAPLRESVVQELGGTELSVVHVASHDTASAVAATPADSRRFAYISCGTWSLMGAEVAAPILSEQALAFNFTNEGGVAGAYRALKNITGLWLLQEMQRHWEREGRPRTWPDITRITEEAPAFLAFINPDDGRFLPPGDMPTRLRDYCGATGQPIPETDGAVARCATESLACKYRWALERLEKIVGHAIEVVHMVGGGIQHKLLCQWTANVCARPVVAGPVEASALGNLAVQLMAAGELASLAEAREVIARSFPLTYYDPRDIPVWDDAYGRFCAVLDAQADAVG